MSRNNRPPSLLRRPGIDDELDGTGGITELEKFDPERVDGVTKPANGFPVLMMKALGNSGTAAEEDTVEDDLAKDGAAKDDDDSPDTGAPGEDIDGAGDSHEDDDDDKASKEASPAVAELAEPSAEAVKAAAADYETARRDYLAGEPGLKGADSATELLKARAEWNHWNSLGKDEGLDGTEDGRKRWIVKHIADTPPAPAEDAAEPEAALTKELLEAEEAVYKRTFTAEERRKAAAAGHALPDGSYPIETKADLPNAAHLASSGHGNVPEAKALIRRRAKELGAANPLDDGNGGPGDSKKEAAANGTVGDSKDSTFKPGMKKCGTCNGDGKIKGGNMTCPDCKGKGAMKPKAAAKKAVRATVEAALAAGMLTEQAAKEILDQVDEVTKTKRPLPASTEPVGAHREPDGTSTIEQLEPEAGLGTDPDKTADKVPASVAALTMKDAPYVVKRMHDALCAAYAEKTVLDEYPALSGAADAVDQGWFSGQAAKAAEAGDTEATADLAALVKAAEAVRSFEPAAVADGRALLHKSFTQMYPQEHISPKDARKPGSYQRPYLSSSHAAESAGNWTVNIPPSTRTPDAADYQRGALTAGHAAPSPGDHGPNNPAGSGHRMVTQSQKDMAMAAMRAMHDHIAAGFAGMCPMAPSVSIMPPGMGAANTPGTTPPPFQGGIPSVAKEAGMPEDTADRMETQAGQKVGGKKKKARKAERIAELEAALGKALAVPAGTDPAAIQNMVAEQLDALTGPLNDQISGLRKQVDELGKQPDPAMAPVRGQIARRPAGDTPAPVEKRSLIEEARDRQTRKAADDREDYLAYLRMQAESHDPKMRERAEEILTKETARVPA